MASRKLIEKIQDQFKDADLSITLQDFTDDEVEELILENNPREWWDLEKVLLDMTSDKEVEAHILGYTSEEVHQEEVRKTNDLIRKVEEWINEH